MSNKCKELGCCACCGETNLTQRIPIDNETFVRLADSAKVLEVGHKDFAGYSMASSQHTENDIIAAKIVNPADNSLWWLVQLIGNCPQLENGDCQLYEDRPIACRIFPSNEEIGGPACAAIQKARGMKK